MEPMKPYMFKAPVALIERADRVANTIPEFERSRARLIRQALREILDRLEPETAERETPEAA